MANEGIRMAVTTAKTPGINYTFKRLLINLIRWGNQQHI